MSELKYRYWLCQIKNLRRASIMKLWEMKKSAYAVYELSSIQLEKLSFLSEQEKVKIIEAKYSKKWEEDWQTLQERRIRIITYMDPDYPSKLKNIYQWPKCLYVKGKMPDEHQISIGIVGARDCTAYGRDMARMFGYRLAEHGIQIISGMAKGIDGWGHQGALEAGKDTFAVLGTGVEVCYPPVHQSLYQSIQKHGGLISEFPIYEKAMPQYFPLRNRIISGLSDGLLVVEAREKSGSLITADAALEQGKDVFVIPGRIGDALSVGCNRLIRQGAIPVLSPQDIFSYYGMVEKEKGEVGENDREQQVLSCIQTEPMHMDNIVASTCLSATDVLICLVRLCKKKKVEEVGRGYYRKKL